MVLGFAHTTKSGNARWRCLCDCGVEVTCQAGDLHNKHTSSCGCLRREVTRARKIKHGQKGTDLYEVWRGMLDRCRNENHVGFRNYGGRGITVYERWKEFVSFRDDILAKIGDKPPGMTLDRIDNDGNYEPGNVRWATRVMQRANQRKAA